ncbi:MAG: glycosyltransferase family 87 protein [Syntrophobacteraceae bacterium]
MWICSHRGVRLGFDSIDWAKLRRFKWVPIASAAAWVVVVWIQIILRPQGDFPLHFELGRRLVKGVFIYEGGLDYVYPPFWAMVHAPLHLFGMHAAQIIVYPLAVVAIAALFLTLQRLSERSIPLSPDGSFWCTTLAILLGSLFLGRDLPEVGVNTALVAMSWLSVYFWSKERDIAGGVVLGMAGALKCTPLLFVAWFVLKGQWKIAAAACAAFALFTLSPVLVSGPDQYGRIMETWIASVVRGVGGLDPSRGPLGEEKVENLSLRPALARYLMNLPYGHLGRPETSDDPRRPNSPPSPYYYQFLDLPVLWAGTVVRLLMAALFIWMVLLMRHRPVSRNSIEIVWECAAVSILILLFSPITWVQHAVGVLPALYLICRAAFAGFSLSRRQTAAMGAYAIFCLIMSRSFFGRDFIKLANSYHLKTLGFILLLSVVLAYRRRFSNMERSNEVNSGAENPQSLPRTNL